MKKLAFMLLIAVASACSSTKHSTANLSNSQNSAITPPIPGADGSSYEKAIVIQETHETTGVNAEYKWLGENYPGYKRGMQSLVTHDKKPYDILSITTAAGVEKKVYFDISNYYGKF